METRWMNAAAAAVVACGAGAARADVFGVPLGTAAPPAEVGLYTMFAAPHDPRLFVDVTAVPDGAGGEITFSRPMSCREIGSGWMTWSHGYTGNVYYTNGATDVTLRYSDAVGAAYLYIEPNPFGVFGITAAGSDGISAVSLSAAVEGDSGATGWAFYSPWSLVHLRTVTVTGDIDFAAGEFGVGLISASPGGPAVLALIASRRERRARA